MGSQGSQAAGPGEGWAHQSSLGLDPVAALWRGALNLALARRPPPCPTTQGHWALGPGAGLGLSQLMPRGLPPLLLLHYKEATFHFPSCHYRVAQLNSSDHTSILSLPVTSF